MDRSDSVCDIHDMLVLEAVLRHLQNHDCKHDEAGEKQAKETESNGEKSQ